MLTLILAESSIERVPSQLRKHPSVIAHARRRRRDPASLILDQNYHHSAMMTVRGEDRSHGLAKRGRPDIAFHVLLQALGSPLNREGLLRTYIHTVDDNVIDIDPSLRPPRNYDRFIGILEQLYDQKSVPPDERPLLSIRQCTLPRLVDEVATSLTIAFSTLGKAASMKDACSQLLSARAPVVLIGGFARSHFKRSTSQLADHIFSVDKEPLDAWVVAGRVIYEYERGIGLPERRLQA
jgi:rRNA small subunit pseudouridine methyltransferase Nep1